MGVHRVDHDLEYGCDCPSGGTIRLTSPVPLTASASSGLTVAFAVLSGPASITNATALLITGAGTVSVRATQPGNANWNAATPVTNTLTVATRAVTVASGLTALNKTYDASAVATISSNAVVLSGVLAADAGWVTLHQTNAASSGRLEYTDTTLLPPEAEPLYRAIHP